MVDASPIVIDEVIGYLVAVAFLPFTWRTALAAFVLFRLFDVLKPWPASALDRWKSGLGVVLDDVAAGVYAWAWLRLLLRLASPEVLAMSLVVELLSTGDELLTGQVVDTNSPWLMDRLWDVGVMVRRKTLVGDDRAVLEAALRETTGRADLVVMSGGMGPTEDDLTAECVARGAGRAARAARPVARAPSRSGSGGCGRPMTPNNVKQARFPRGAEVHPNRFGTAPGFTRPGRAGHAHLPAGRAGRVPGAGRGGGAAVDGGAAGRGAGRPGAEAARRRGVGTPTRPMRPVMDDPA